MGRNRISSEDKARRGNPGKRPLPAEHEVPIASLRCPPGLSKLEKKYWKIWAPPLSEIGKLTVMTVPSFLVLLKMKSRLEEVNRFLDENNRSLLQETKFVDQSGQEHSSFRESAYSKLSRDLTVAVYRLEKSWGLTADSMAGLFKAKPKQSAEEAFLG